MIRITCSVAVSPWVATSRSSLGFAGAEYQPPSCGNTMDWLAVALSTLNRRSLVPDPDSASTASDMPLSTDTIIRYLLPTGKASPLRCCVMAPPA
jgi:hypothetical protein